MSREGVAAALAARLEGEVAGPGDDAYEQLRRTANARVDRHPAAIAGCVSREDVAAALAIAAERGLPVAVRGAGTSDDATVDGGVVLDLAELRTLAVDPVSRTASAGAGVTWAELDEATQEHGLAVTGARLSRVGVAGVAIGDGSGWLERALGPTAASLTGAEVVLADGRVLEADGDLLWALRGAGARVGVVTRVDLRLHPVGPELLAGFLSFPRDRAAEIAAAYRDYMHGAPDEVGGGLLLGAGLGGVCTIVFSHLGALEAGEAAVAPLRALGPSLDAVMPNPYVSLQRIWDAGNPVGTRAHVRGAFLRELTDGCLAAAVARVDLPAASLSHLFLQPLGGALARSRPEEMALRIPDAPWAYQCAGLWPPVPSLDDGQRRWVDGVADAFGPDALPAAYPSLTGGYEPHVREPARRYDPAGVFSREPPPAPPQAPRPRG